MGSSRVAQSHSDSLLDFQPSSKQTFSDALVESKRRRRNLVALILGMNVAQAVREGLIVESIASEPGSVQYEAEEPLFVSDEETQESAPTPKVPTPFGSQFGASTNAFGSQNNQLNATPQSTGFFGLGSQAKSHLSPTASPFNPPHSFASPTVSFPFFVDMFRDWRRVGWYFPSLPTFSLISLGCL
jgi:hypothetical protein